VQVLNLVPKEADGERFEDALTRVCRCIGCGNATDTADSDSDLEVVADSVTVNLRCPVGPWVTLLIVPYLQMSFFVACTDLFLRHLFW